MIQSTFEQLASEIGFQCGIFYNEGLVGIVVEKAVIVLQGLTTLVKTVLMEEMVQEAILLQSTPKVMHL